MAGSLLTALAVALEIATGWTNQDVETLTRTCTESLGSGACARVETGAEPPHASTDPNDPIVTARIEAPVEDHVVVEVTVELARERRSAVRDLLFQPADPASERARSVGLTIALLTLELLPRTGDEPPVEKAEAPPPGKAAPTPSAAHPAPPDETPTEEPPFLFGLGGDALLESSLGVGRFGGSLWFGWRPIRRLALGARMSVTTTSVAGESGTSNLTLLWASPALGAGYDLTQGPLGVRPSLELGLDWLTASLADSAAAAARGGRASPTITAAVTLRMPGNRPAAVVVVPYAAVNTWPTAITVDGVEVGATSPLTLGVRLGFEWAPARSARSR